MPWDLDFNFMTKFDIIEEIHLKSTFYLLTYIISI